MQGPIPHPPAPHGGLEFGTVTDNDDPEQAGRVRLRITSIDPRNEHPHWAKPFGVAYGTAGASWIAPPIGAVVAVFFLRGDPSAPYWMPGPWPATPPTSAGSQPTEGKVPAPARSQPGQLKNAYPKVRVLYSDDRGLLITEDDVGEIDVSTRSRPIRVKTLGARIEIDARDGSGGEVVINRGDKGAARVGDSVSVTIPIGAIMVPGSPPVSNPTAITLTGTIENGSTTVKIG